MPLDSRDGERIPADDARRDELFEYDPGGRAASQCIGHALDAIIRGNPHDDVLAGCNLEVLENEGSRKVERAGPALDSGYSVAVRF